MSTQSAPTTGRLPYGQGRQALIDAAIRLVAREGLTKLTYRSLAAEAQSSKGAVQHSFSSIDEVIEAALEQCLSVSLQGFADAAETADFFEPLLDALRDYPDAQTFQADVLFESRRNPKLRQLVIRHQAKYREYMRSALLALSLEASDPLIDLLMALADGIIYQRVAFGADGDGVMEAQVGELRRIMNALGATPTGR